MNALFARYRQLSFFKKQLLVATIVTSITLVLASTLLYGKFIADHQSRLLENLQGKARLIAATSRSALLFGDNDAAAEILSSLKAFPATQYALLLDQDKQIFASYRRSEDINLPEMAQLSDYLDADDRLYVHHPVRQDNEVVGYVIIESDTTALTDQRLNYILILCLVFLVSMAVSFFYTGGYRLF